jgi:hypothetical protein
MSPSEECAKLSALAAQLGEQVERTIHGDELAQVRAEDITKLMSSAVKLYAAQVEEAEPGPGASVIDDTVSTTEAMVVACALLRAHRLNPFDLALWFQRTAPSRDRL